MQLKYNISENCKYLKVIIYGFLFFALKNRYENLNLKLKSQMVCIINTEYNSLIVNIVSAVRIN